MELYGRSTGSNGSQSDHQSEWVPVEQESGLDESMQRLGLWGREIYPERPGVPDCSYYMRTGSCGYGANCRYNHPRDRAYGAKMQLERVEFPERLGEPMCQYYLRTGACKFGASCKFHHPRNLGGSLSNVPLNTYGYPLRPGPVSPALSPGAQPSAAVTSIYGISQLASSTHAFAGPYSPLHSAASPSSKTQKEKSFPDRPGQPTCQYYMKTGDCKFGSSCRYHHPPDWIASKTNFAISPLGLPLRPGVQPCSFYLLKGFCKFGRACKFDHPMGTVQYSSSASSLPDLPIAPYMLRSSFAFAPTLLPELQAGFVSGSKVDAASLSRPSSSLKVQLVELT
ncbi:zinc finger CCCH domain-containing protein 32 isoform X2 [Nicotiana tomentosiformis]|uniref:Zinc finger CCCH domain-containing protein 32 isoform X2 n=1 Tax=Nicotiana tabacum TaxID=4097 RepID=A0A1S4D262_TOBAC|nr:PREDICTED: zinc finger CCCH domain-containing protein 32-like isoform X2 [Nicotiana tabacum]XP_018633466.1 zinc finger CCCH domain-containing protein 32 isoform X3 [Nicotiana tomentosiformis]